MCIRDRLYSTEIDGLVQQQELQPCLSGQFVYVIMTFRISQAQKAYWNGFSLILNTQNRQNVQCCTKLAKGNLKR